MEDETPKEANKETTKTKKSAPKKTKDFGISKPRAPSDGITPQTKVSDYLRSNSPIGYSEDYRSSYLPKTVKDHPERSPSSLRIEEDGRARSRTGFTPPIDVESEKFVESVNREIEKAEKRSGSPPLSQRPNYTPFSDSVDGYTRKYNPIKAEFTTYNAEKPHRMRNPYLSEPNIAAAVSHMLDSTGPSYPFSGSYNPNRFKSIDEDYSHSGSLGRIPSARDVPKRSSSPILEDYHGSLKNIGHYNKPNEGDRYLSRDKPRSQYDMDKYSTPYKASGLLHEPIFDDPLSGDPPAVSTSLKWENDDLKQRLKKQDDELTRLQKDVRDSYDDAFDMSRPTQMRPKAQPKTDFLVKENDILKKRLDDQQLQIDRLKKEIRNAASQKSFSEPPSSRYDSMPDLSPYRGDYSSRKPDPYTPMSTLETPSRSVKFFDEDFNNQMSTPKMDSSNASAIRNADKILSEIDELISSAKKEVSKPSGSDLSSTYVRPIDSTWRSTYTGSAFQSPKLSASKEKLNYSAPSTGHMMEAPYKQTVKGGIPPSSITSSFGFEAATPKTYQTTDFRPKDDSKSIPNSTYDSDHLRKVADVKAKLDAESRKQERLEAAMNEIHNRRGNSFNSANPPIILSRPVPDSSNMLRPIPRQNYGPVYSPRSNNISCQVYALDDELQDKGRSPGASLGRGTFNRMPPERDYVTNDQPIKESYFDDYLEEDIYPKEPAPSNERSLDDFRRKTRGLMERQHKISENILKKFKELDLMLPSSSDRVSNGYDDDDDMESSRGYPVKPYSRTANPFSNSSSMPRQQTSNRGLSSWDSQYKSAPRSSYTRRYDSGSFSMRKPNDPWKKSIQKPWSKDEEKGFQRSLSPLVMDYERNGSK